MRRKLKYALPIAQMLLALALLWQSRVWDKAARRTADMPGPSPEFTLLVSINFPVALARGLWLHYTPYFWDDALLIGGIGLLWCWVALNLYSWRRYRSVFTFSWMPARLAVDLLLVAVGGLSAFVFIDGHASHFPPSLAREPRLWFATVA